MNHIPVVIGANFGDEGKGLMTDFLVHKSLQENPEKQVICIRHNGGAQAGHTVNYADGRSFIFNSIPSGCGVDKSVIGYLGPEFYLNPTALIKEINRFEAFFGWTPKIKIDSNCRIVTPWDVGANQLLEESRGEEKSHGSCGHGIFECFLRNSSNTTSMAINDGSPSTIRAIRYYGLNRMWRVSSGKFDVATYCSQELLDSFFKSIRIVKELNTHIRNSDVAIVVEGAQGIGLSENLLKHYPWDPHLTPSDPGIRSAVYAICKFMSGAQNFDFCVSPIYVTRSYLTRHGNGPMYSSMSNKRIPEITNFSDDTNKPNIWQGNQRRAPLDIDELEYRITRDLFYMPVGAAFWKPSIAVTWAQKDTNLGILSMPVNYLSTGKLRTDVYTTNQREN